MSERFKITDDLTHYFEFEMNGEVYRWESEGLVAELRNLLKENPVTDEMGDHDYLNAIVIYVHNQTDKDLTLSQARMLEGAIYADHEAFKKKALSPLMSVLNTESRQASSLEKTLSSLQPTANGTGPKQKSDTDNGTAS